LLQFVSLYWTLRNLKVSIQFSLLGALLLGLLPTFYIRAGHLNLLPHFLIIFGWGLVLSETISLRGKFISFILLIQISLLVHFYFTPPLILMAFITIYNEYKDDASKLNSLDLLSKFAIIVASTFFAMYSLGYFGTFKMDGGGYGLYSSNLNSLINSRGTSSFWQALPIGLPGQEEGYQYLGTGIILFLSLSALMLKGETFNNVPRNIIYFWLCLFVFSLSNKIYFNQYLILEIPLPRLLMKLFDAFRASGRYMWFVIYPVLLIVFSNAYKKLFRINLNTLTSSRSSGIYSAILIVLFCLQFYDISSVLRAHRFHTQTIERPSDDIIKTASKMYQYALLNQFDGPIYIDSPDPDASKTLFSILSSELLPLKFTSISPSPNVRDNMKYKNRNHINETLNSDGVVITQSCDKDQYLIINLHNNWCILKLLIESRKPKI